MSELDLEDIILETLRAIVVAGLLIWLLWRSRKHRHVQGWQWVVAGFSLLCFASLIDITDNFDSLNHFILIGDTKVESFLEKVVGYLFGFICLSIGFYIWLPAVHAHELHLKEEIQMLHGLLPICASCKKIRDEEGKWQHIEAYISKRSDAEFTHGICPECSHQLYGTSLE